MYSSNYKLAYGYDWRDQLEAVFSEGNYPGQSENYTYDNSGNRNSGSGEDYNLRNELLSRGGFTYEYDLNGNIRRKTGTDPELNLPATVEYHHDAENRLEHIVARRSTSNTPWYGAYYAYDPLGRRIAMGILPKGGDAVAGDWDFTFFAYDGDDILAEYFTGVDGSAGFSPHGSSNIKSLHLHGPGVDEHLAWWMRDHRQPDWREAKMKEYLILADGLGSTTGLLGREEGTNQKKILGKFIYDSFGNTIEICGDIASMYRYRYAGREWDDYTATGTSDLGLYNNRARYYDPAIGRFLQEDPASNLNLYMYANNSPIYLYDPFGMEAWAYGIGYSAAVGAVVSIDAMVAWDDVNGLGSVSDKLSMGIGIEGSIGKTGGGVVLHLTDPKATVKDFDGFSYKVGGSTPLYKLVKKAGLSVGAIQDLEGNVIGEYWELESATKLSFPAPEIEISVTTEGPHGFLTEVFTDIGKGFIQLFSGVL